MSETTPVSEEVSTTNGEEAPQMPPEVPPPTPEEIVTPEVLEKIIKGYNVNCDLVDFSAKLGTAVGDNYMSIMYAVTINLKNRKSGESESIRVMLKTMPRNPWRIQMINDCGAFIKDAKMYQEIFPAMVAFQKEKGLKDEEIFRPWPECYVTFHDGKTDYLGMEDLRVSGYQMASRHTGLDMVHTTLVLKNIARFHAVSYAMFGGDFQKILEKYPFLEEKMFLPEDKVPEQTKMWLSATMKTESETVEKEGFPEAAQLLLKLDDDHPWGKLYDLIGTNVKHSVIGHGDCWTNNMMFTYDGEIPQRLKFVDFQLSRVSSRCVDLHYFFYSSPQLNIVNDKEEEVKKIYFDEFSSFAQKLGVDLQESELTWENFLEEFEIYRYYGVVMGLMLAPILAADSKDVPDMETIKEEDFTNEGSADFMNKFMGNNAAKKICNIAVKHLPKCLQAPKN